MSVKTPRRRTPGPRRPPATPLPPSDSRQRILHAAAAEFALRGFEPATVDRIARRARLNKAMIYYHFRSKRALYTSVLRTLFTLMGDCLAATAASTDPPQVRLDRFVSAFVLEGQRLAHFAPIMLRELASGGRRLDEETLAVTARVAGILRSILDQGRRDGAFAPVDPLLLALTTIWPIVAYLASGPIRHAVARISHAEPGRLDPDRFILHLQTLNRRALTPAAAADIPTGVTS